MYRIKFVIGDWSEDGHSQSDEYLFLSSLPVEDLRELHFDAKEILGFPVGRICGEYDVSNVTADQHEVLANLGILEGEYDEDIGLTAHTIMDIWASIIRVTAAHKNIPLTLNICTETSNVTAADLDVLLQKSAIDVKSNFPDISGEHLMQLLNSLAKAADNDGSRFTVQLFKNQQVPTMHFYGYDSKGRHLDVPGYGIYNN